VNQKFLISRENIRKCWKKQGGIWEVGVRGKQKNEKGEKEVFGENERQKRLLFLGGDFVERGSGKVKKYLT